VRRLQAVRNWMRRVFAIVTGATMCLASITTSPGAAGAWEVPNGAATAVSGVFPFADPAAAGYGTSGIGQQLYSTSGSGYNIPTENWVTVGGATTNGYGDALYTPAADRASLMFAPDVQFINGQYVMWYVGKPLPTNNNPNPPAQLENATSATPQGPFTVHSAFNSGSTYGLFDPYLWQDSAGSWWIFWSQENGQTHSANSILLAELSYDSKFWHPGPTQPTW